MPPGTQKRFLSETPLLKTIAKELFQVFSHVGLPKEVLTDRGTPFMSRVTKELCKLLKVTQLRTYISISPSDRRVSGKV